MKRVFAALVCILLLTAVASPVFAAPSVPDAVMKSTQSVVRVLSEYGDGYATGSGFVIKSDGQETLIATNYHVVEDDPYSISIWVGEEETVSATILAYTDQKDMCILRLTYPVALKPLPFAANGAKQGDAVYAVGFPGAADYLSDKEAHTSADATITDGIVSAVREATTSGYGTAVKILQVNAAINHGNSGGPLFNAKGQVVGINTYGIGDSQGIFGAIDGSELRAFLADNGIAASGADFPWIVLAAVGGVLLCAGAVVLVLKIRKVPKKKKFIPVSLRDYMAEHPEGIDMNEAVAMLLPVALQLRDLHNDGKTHLQVSPNSITVGESGGILAAATSSEADRYTSGYAAPEVYKGTSAGNRTDVYSFCALLSYVASGVQPENALSRVEGEEPENQGFDDAFGAVIRTGMALEPAERFASMQDVILQLSAYNTAPFAAVPVEQSAPAVPEKKRRASTGKVVGIVAAVLVAVLAAGYFGCYFGAMASAGKGNFAAADRLLFAAPLTSLHDGYLVAYVNAGKLMEDRQYEKASVAFARLGAYRDAENMTMESKYRHALQLASANSFTFAEIALGDLKAEGYKDADSKLQEVRYRHGMFLMQEGSYDAAYLKLTALKGYAPAQEVIPVLKELLYAEAQTCYHADDYSKARHLFGMLDNYEDCKKYEILLNVKAGDGVWYDPADIAKQLQEIFYFEDAAELLVSKIDIACYFLLGTWRTSGGGYYFKIDEAYSAWYNLPVFNFGKYYYISDGVYGLEDDSGNRKPLYGFTLLTPDSMEVYCYKDGSTYTLYRQ